MNPLQTLRSGHRNKICEARSIDRTINSDEFATAFEKADDLSREAVSGIVRNGNKAALEDWLRVARQTSHAEMSLRELRVVGQQLGVRHYNRLPKALLLSEIQNATKRHHQAAS